MDGGAWWAAVHGVAKSRTRRSNFTFILTCMHWRRKWQPTPMFLPGESQGWGSLVGYCLWGHTSWTPLRWLSSSRLVITFLPRSKLLLISWLLSQSAVILEPRKIKSATDSIVSPSICHEVMGLDAMILVFWILSFKQTFSLSTITFINSLFSSSSLSAIGWCHLHIWSDWYFSQQSWFQLVLLLAQRFSCCTLHIS